MQLIFVLLIALVASAQDTTVDVATSVFHESGGPLSSTVITPHVAARTEIGAIGIGAAYEADVVTGASIAVVDAPASGVDVIASASQLEDTRHTARGELALRDGDSSLRASYAYGTERDYRSHSISFGGRAELFDRTMTLDVGYARSFDGACNLAQPRAQEATDRVRMPDADGCFTDGGTRETLDLDQHGLSGAWTQLWSPVLSTQLSSTLQLLHGYQGNPYRAVWLGEASAQENHPSERARYAAALDVRLWLEPLAGALQLRTRVYRDTWDIESIAVEVAYEQAIGPSMRLRIRGRGYTQTGAAFYSDDYALAPRGQYFTGDRELSAMKTLTIGGRFEWSIPTADDGMVLGFLGGLVLVAKGDFISYDFPDFHYGRANVPISNALALSAGLEASL